MSDDSTTTRSVEPQWEPPTHLNDPFVTRLALPKGKWSRVVRRRIPKPMDAYIAHTLASYGSGKGTNCHPGVERLAEDTGYSTASVKRSLAWLTENGWITREARSARKLGLADVYRVTIPATVAAELGWWTEEHGPQWIERPAKEPKRPGMRERSGPQKRGPKPSRKGSETLLDEQVLGIRNSDVGIRNPVSRDQSCEPPSGRESPVPSFSHHSELVAPAHADARAHEEPSFDEDGEDVDEAIVEHVMSLIGGPLSIDVESGVRGMVAKGCHPKMIVRWAMAQERERDRMTAINDLQARLRAYQVAAQARFPVGTPVAYDDEDPADLGDDARGVIVEPTPAELEHAKTCSDPVGPDAGDVLVEWGGQAWDRSWVRPDDLQILP